MTTFIFKGAFKFSVCVCNTSDYHPFLLKQMQTDAGESGINRIQKVNGIEKHVSGLSPFCKFQWARTTSEVKREAMGGERPNFCQHSLCRIWWGPGLASTPEPIECQTWLVAVGWSATNWRRVWSLPCGEWRAGWPGEWAVAWHDEDTGLGPGTEGDPSHGRAPGHGIVSLELGKANRHHPPCLKGAGHAGHGDVGSLTDMHFAGYGGTIPWHISRHRDYVN